MGRSKLPAKDCFGLGGYRIHRLRSSKTKFSIAVRMEPDENHDKRWWSKKLKVEIQTPDDPTELLYHADRYAWALTHPDEIAKVQAADDERHQPLSEYLKVYRAWRLEDASLKGETLDREEVELTKIDHYLGSMPLCNITTQGIETAYAAMTADGISNYTVSRTHTKLKKILANAFDDGLIAENPATRVKRNKPKTPKPSIDYKNERRITPEEAAALASRISSEEPDGMRAAIWLARFTGMRRGEVLGLHWADIDTEQRLIHVRRQLDRNRVERDPKTEAAIRDIPFLNPVWAYLERWQTKQKEQFAQAKKRWSKNVPVCTNEKLVAFRPDNFNRALRVYFESCGLGEFTDRSTFKAQRKNKKGEKVKYDCSRKSGYVGAGMHSLRHTYATELVSAGVNPKVAQELLGHENIQTTLDLYAETLLEDKRSAVATVAAMQFENWGDYDIPVEYDVEE